jgi:hypothetical protein
LQAVGKYAEFYIQSDFDKDSQCFPFKETTQNVPLALIVSQHFGLKVFPTSTVAAAEQQPTSEKTT